MKKVLLSLLAIVLIIEEWLWDALTALGHVLIRQLNLEGVERWLSHLTPNGALIAFLIPVLVVMPINLVVIDLLTHGLILQGVLLEILAKLLGTLLVSRVFALTKPQLLTFKSFAFVYSTIMGWLHWAHQKIVETMTYRFVKAVQARVRRYFYNWFR
jgi:hypothetical protein